MRFSTILGLGLALAASAGFAQQSKAYQPKKSYAGDKKSASAVPMTKSSAPTTSASRDLRRIEQESARSQAGASAKASKPRSGAVLLKTPSSRTINAAGGGGMGTNTRGGMMAGQGKNPYKGRLRTKGGH